MAYELEVHSNTKNETKAHCDLAEASFKTKHRNHKYSLNNWVISTVFFIVIFEKHLEIEKLGQISFNELEK